MRSLVLHNSLYGNVQLVLDNAVSVLDVKSVVSLYFGIQIREIILIYQGSILNNSQILTECGIQEKSVIYGVFKAKTYPYVFERFNKYCTYSEEDIRRILHKMAAKQNGYACTEADIEEKIPFMQHPQGLTELSKISDKQQMIAEYKIPRLINRCRTSVIQQNYHCPTVIPEKALAPSTDPLPVCFRNLRNSSSTSSDYPLTIPNKNNDCPIFSTKLHQDSS